MAENFDIKDSGKRMTFDTGMVRDSGEKTLRPDLIWLPGLVRLAELYGKGALKYAERNWEKAATMAEMLRFKASAFRHFVQWFRGDRDEDHCSAVVFNMWGAEMVKGKLDAKTSDKSPMDYGSHANYDAVCPDSCECRVPTGDSE